MYAASSAGMQTLSGHAKVDRMSQESQQPYQDPSGNTEAFEAFVRRTGGPQVEPPKSNASTGIIIGVVVAVIVIAIVVWLVVAN